MKTLFFSLTILTFAASGHAGALPFRFVPQVQATGAWVTADQVLRSLETEPAGLRTRLAKLRLAPVRNCADMRLSAVALAREIDRALPGVFSPDIVDSPQVVRVRVQGQTLSPIEIATLAESTLVRQCPEALVKPCELRVTPPAEPVCIAQGKVESQTRVTQTPGGPPPLQVNLAVSVDGVHSASLRLSARPITAWAAWRVLNPVARGQALRQFDVEAASASDAVSVQTRYDQGRGVVVAKYDLSVGDVIAADTEQRLANARRDDEVSVRSAVGQVVVHRSANLAADRPTGNAVWAHFNNGEIVAVRPRRDGTWELSQ